MPEIDPPDQGTPMLSSQATIDISQQLGHSWRELADYFDIPEIDRDRFGKDDEGQATWRWILQRGRLRELAQGLRAANRHDLASLWEQQQAISSRRYYEACIERWSQPRYAFDQRCVSLALLLDQGETAQGPRWQMIDQRFHHLADILQQAPNQAFVLLGAAGSGKSTLLRHYELENARAALARPAEDDLRHGPLTFFVTLNNYRTERTDNLLPLPADWLAEQWGTRHPDLPPLVDLLRAKRLTLLLDALNEMPHMGDAPVRLWKDFLSTLDRDYPGNRVIFACSTLAYSAPLSSTEHPVPHIYLEPLSNAQVRAFIERHGPKHADALWNNLKGSPQLNWLRLPYYLTMFVQLAVSNDIPTGRAALLTAFVRHALKREVEASNPRFAADTLLTNGDLARLNHNRWRTPYELPGRGVLFDRLSTLAFEMQTRNAALDAVQMRIPYHDALSILQEQGTEILQAGDALEVLELDPDCREVRYTHQLMQEFFAARRLAVRPDSKRVQVARQVDQTSPNLRDTLARLADADTLPLLPVPSWEETIVIAAAMTAQPDAFVSDLMAANLPLAGHCAAQPDVQLSEELKNQIRWALVQRAQDVDTDLRRRIAAGRSLGTLGDPRFERRQGPDGAYLMSPLIAVPSGSYVIGSDEGHDEDEMPVHTVDLKAFHIGQFAVTNAEWTLFIQAGGYEDERWWLTAADRAWRRGESTAEGPKEAWRDYRKFVQNDFDSFCQRSDVTPAEIEQWTQYIRMTDEEFEAVLDRMHPPSQLTQPAFWDNQTWNHPAQPVVGICWHEARAYCAWLSVQTDWHFRLPTEVEWEAAARGMQGRRYAYGNDFNAACCNTLATHLRRTAPIGVFPGGDTPAPGRLADMTGNVWEWTSSAYVPYPYVIDDGRENILDDKPHRVIRGGSWYSTPIVARSAFRYRDRPGSRLDVLGLRVVCSPPSS